MAVGSILLNPRIVDVGHGEVVTDCKGAAIVARIAATYTARYHAAGAARSFCGLFSQAISNTVFAPRDGEQGVGSGFAERPSASFSRVAEGKDLPARGLPVIPVRVDYSSMDPSVPFGIIVEPLEVPVVEDPSPILSDARLYKIGDHLCHIVAGDTKMECQAAVQNRGKYQEAQACRGGVQPAPPPASKGPHCGPRANKRQKLFGLTQRPLLVLEEVLWLSLLTTLYWAPKSGSAPATRRPTFRRAPEIPGLRALLPLTDRIICVLNVDTALRCAVSSIADVGYADSTATVELYAKKFKVVCASCRDAHLKQLKRTASPSRSRPVCVNRKRASETDPQEALEDVAATRDACATASERNIIVILIGGT
eukprot:3359783-Amphidinium_carterae.6